MRFGFEANPSKEQKQNLWRGEVVGRLARIDRSHAPAWERRQGRSAFRFCKVTQSVTGCIPTRSVGTIKPVALRTGNSP
ncbi:hypothetical protein J2W43_005510 [Pseudomonas brassicacearum]|uniref:Uncharacterized protein n=1 Tax=Pseudomonas brassicacearum TaxID=930166 RepID=A0AAW8MKD4_9PSED|nr:hypothetical protein [Pseudomonas brassicacearum]